MDRKDRSAVWSTKRRVVHSVLQSDEDKNGKFVDDSL